jgi:amino acid permease
MLSYWLLDALVQPGDCSLFNIFFLMWLLQTEQLEPGLRFLPIFYAATIVINLFSVFYDGPSSEYDCAWL